MAHENNLTKQDLLEALKPLATKEDVRQIVSAEIAARGLATKDDLVALEKRMDGKQVGMESRTDAKLAGLEKRMDEKFTSLESRLKGYVQEGVDTVVKAIDETGKRHNQRFDKIEQELKMINRRLLGLEQDTVSKKEFAELKSRVDSYHPFN